MNSSVVLDVKQFPERTEPTVSKSGVRLFHTRLGIKLEFLYHVTLHLRISVIRISTPHIVMNMYKNFLLRSRSTM